MVSSESPTLFHLEQRRRRTSPGRWPTSTSTSKSKHLHHNKHQHKHNNINISIINNISIKTSSIINHDKPDPLARRLLQAQATKHRQACPVPTYMKLIIYIIIHHCLAPLLRTRKPFFRKTCSSRPICLDKIPTDVQFFKCFTPAQFQTFQNFQKNLVNSDIATVSRGKTVVLLDFVQITT